MPGERRGVPARSLLRWSPYLLLVLVAAVALVIGTSGRHGQQPRTLEQRVLAIASQVRCPVCEGETVAESQASESADIRAEIRQELQAGEKPAAIIAGLVADFGPGILEKPRAGGIALLLWVVPVVAVLLAAAGLAAVFAYWRPRRAAALSDADRSLVAEALDEDDRS